MELKDVHDHLKKRSKSFSAQKAIILGSGFSRIAAEINIEFRIPFHELPGFPPATVTGHKGEWIGGYYRENPIWVLNGRLHRYEGHNMNLLSVPIRLLSLSGVQTIVITNAVGTLRKDIPVGSLVSIEDHINFCFENPLTGPNLDDFGPRFPDTSKIYSPDLIALARTLATNRDVHLHNGVYAYTMGPMFETPAEVNMIRTLGADVVGMSLVPEALVAGHCGISVAAFSIVSNLASGLGKESLSHTDVLDAMDQSSDSVFGFLMEFVNALG
jgi:purine-nucleoside phosphorylase